MTERIAKGSGFHWKTGTKPFAGERKDDAEGSGTFTSEQVGHASEYTPQESPIGTKGQGENGTPLAQLGQWTDVGRPTGNGESYAKEPENGAQPAESMEEKADDAFDQSENGAEVQSPGIQEKEQPEGLKVNTGVEEQEQKDFSEKVAAHMREQHPESSVVQNEREPSSTDGNQENEAAHVDNGYPAGVGAGDGRPLGKMRTAYMQGRVGMDALYRFADTHHMDTVDVGRILNMTDRNGVEHAVALPADPQQLERFRAWAGSRALLTDDPKERELYSNASAAAQFEQDRTDPSFKGYESASSSAGASDNVPAPASQSPDPAEAEAEAQSGPSDEEVQEELRRREREIAWRHTRNALGSLAATAPGTALQGAAQGIGSVTRLVDRFLSGGAMSMPSSVVAESIAGADTAGRLAREASRAMGIAEDADREALKGTYKGRLLEARSRAEREGIVKAHQWMGSQGSLDDMGFDELDAFENGLNGRVRDIAGRLQQDAANRRILQESHGMTTVPVKTLSNSERRALNAELNALNDVSKGIRSRRSELRYERTVQRDADRRAEQGRRDAFYEASGPDSDERLAMDVSGIRTHRWQTVADPSDPSRQVLVPGDSGEASRMVRSLRHEALLAQQQGDTDRAKRLATVAERYHRTIETDSQRTAREKREEKQRIYNQSPDHIKGFSDAVGRRGIPVAEVDMDGTKVQIPASVAGNHGDQRRYAQWAREQARILDPSDPQTPAKRAELLRTAEAAEREVMLSRPGTTDGDRAYYLSDDDPSRRDDRRALQSRFGMHARFEQDAQGDDTIYPRDRSQYARWADTLEQKGRRYDALRVRTRYAELRADPSAGDYRNALGDMDTTRSLFSETPQVDPSALDRGGDALRSVLKAHPDLAEPAAHYRATLAVTTGRHAVDRLSRSPRNATLKADVGQLVDRWASDAAAAVEGGADPVEVYDRLQARMDYADLRAQSLGRGGLNDRMTRSIPGVLKRRDRLDPWTADYLEKAQDAYRLLAARGFDPDDPGRAARDLETLDSYTWGLLQDARSQLWGGRGRGGRSAPKAKGTPTVPSAPALAGAAPAPPVQTGVLTLEQVQGLTTAITSFNSTVSSLIAQNGGNGAQLSPQQVSQIVTQTVDALTPVLGRQIAEAVGTYLSSSADGEPPTGDDLQDRALDLVDTVKKKVPEEIDPNTPPEKLQGANEGEFDLKEEAVKNLYRNLKSNKARNTANAELKSAVTRAKEHMANGGLTEDDITILVAHAEQLLPLSKLKNTDKYRDVTGSEDIRKLMDSVLDAYNRSKGKRLVTNETFKGLIEDALTKYKPKVRTGTTEGQDEPEAVEPKPTTQKKNPVSQGFEDYVSRYNRSNGSNIKDAADSLSEAVKGSSDDAIGFFMNDVAARLNGTSNLNKGSQYGMGLLAEAIRQGVEDYEGRFSQNKDELDLLEDLAEGYERMDLKEIRNAIDRYRNRQSSVRASSDPSVPSASSIAKAQRMRLAARVIAAARLGCDVDPELLQGVLSFAKSEVLGFIRTWDA